MAGHENGLQRIFTGPEQISVVQRAQSRIYFRHLFGHGRVRAVHFLQELEGKSFLQITAETRFRPLLHMKLLQQPEIDPAYANMPLRSREKVRHPAVVGMQVRDQDIPPGRIRSQLPQPRLQRLPAGRPSKSRVDQQVGMLPADEIAVQLF